MGADRTREKFRVREEDFTRSRVLTFTITAVSILRGHKFSLQNALNKVFEALGKLRQVPTNSALCQARQKIKPSLFVHLHHAVRDDFYKLYGQDGEVLTWRGHRVLAYDGSDVNLPDTPQLRQAFSVQRNQHGSECVQALAGVLYDVRNDLALAAEIGPLQAEKNFLLGACWSATRRGDLIIMDRLFDDYSVIACAYHHGRHVLIRCPRGNSFKLVQEFWDSDDTEWLVDLPLPQTPATRAFVREKGLPQSVPVRLIKVTLDTDETEVLLTTLCDQRRYPTKEFKAVYFWRWNEETFVDRLKNIFEAERFSGFSATAIQQDFFGVIFLATLESVLTKAPQSKLAEHDRRRHNKTKAQVNRAVSYVALVERAVQLLADPRADTEAVLADLHFLFTRDPTRNREGRKFERKKPKHSARLRFYRYKKRICA